MASNVDWPVTARTMRRVSSNSCFEHGEDARLQLLVFDEGGVEAGDAEVGFGQSHFDVADDVDEEREGTEDGLEMDEACNSSSSTREA